MRISMPRGDIRLVPFGISHRDEAIDADVPCDIDFTEIYFTVKKKYSDLDYCFQKRLSDGGITKIEPGSYQIKIMPEDTANMAISKPGEHYDCDIQIQYYDEIKETTVGEFVLTKEVTWLQNEVQP